MFVQMILDFLYKLFDVIFGWFHLPQLPDTVIDLFENAKDYMYGGIGLLRGLVGETCMGVIAVLFNLVLLLNGAYITYNLIFWVVRKIPFFNIKE